MEITKKQTDNKITLSLSGRLDVSSSPKLQEVLIAAISTNYIVELDFSKLEYVSSAGLRVLLMGEKTAKSKNAQMILTNVSAEVSEVFKMTGFADILTIK